MPIAKLEFRSRWKSVLIKSVIMSFIIVSLLFFYQFYRLDLINIYQRIELLPIEFISFIGMGGSFSFLKHIDFYACIRMFMNIFIAYYALMAGCNMLIREEQEETSSFFYAQPTGRINILFGKFAANIILQLLLETILFLSSAAVIFTYVTYDIKRTVLLLNLMKISAGSLFVGIFFLVLGILYSSRASKRSISADFSFQIILYSILLGEIPQILRVVKLLFLMAGRPLDILEKLAGQLYFLTYLSPLTWVLPDRMMVQGISHSYIIFAVILILTCMFATIALYYKKDIE